MSRSRWGGFRRGWKQYRELWNNLRSEKAVIESVEAPTTIEEFNYKNAQGIWNLNSTVNFRGTPGAGGEAGGGGSTPTYTTGFSSSLFTVSGQLDAWSSRTVDISAYAGATVRLVFHYTNGADDFTGDIQIDDINLDGNQYSFESNNDSFETSRNDESTYASVSWFDVLTGTTSGRWNRDSGGTPSNGTGRTDAGAGSFYIYAETTNPANVLGYNFWARSPQVTLGSNPTLTFKEARLGAHIGTLNVHLDVIA